MSKESALDKSSSPTSIITDYTDFLNSNSHLLFKQFESTYKRKKFYEKELGFIKPEEVLLKTTSTFDDSDKKIEKSSFGYYIPFERSLSKHLENIPKYNDLNKFNQNDTINTHLNFDIFDGKYVKKILETRTLNKNFLSFLIYCDEMEQTNAIGTSRSKHKLSMIFIINIKSLNYLNCNLYIF